MIWQWLAILTASAAAGGDMIPADPVAMPMVDTMSPAPEPVFQVRIEQRIIIRIPRRSSDRVQLSATRPARTPAAAPPPRLVEKKMKQCLASDQIVGMTPSRSRALDFITRDRQRIRAYLDGGCLAMDFHAGLYMERSKDGKVCAGRDVLMARSGMRCEIDRLRRVVAETKN
ncbi:hypothetical protein [Novosphingopyxis sp. YJ-S2-01]|uniref:hypothetical protein n=1 Tax=Novosphingopyxis sp. YJ-S2-01 TaxID=2794021 RepID=UPI0018DCB7DA|nr:hypothetical protein [Novosphingopyxis sp. YJ-S2-01]MBH9536219.1 hypothetical protein [Novosphingopyxis sp. YJ-S2-01]